MGWDLLFARADLAVAQREFEQVLALHDPADLPDSSPDALHGKIPYYLSLLAQARARAGDVQGALTHCRDAQEAAQRTEEQIWLSELHRIEGEVRRAAGRPAGDVEACYESALDVSRQQGARMFELRAATALARLWRKEGKIVQAHDLLASVYGRFTEG
jgi:predicted ATPase